MSTFSNRTVAGSNPIGEEWAQAWSLLILLKSRNQSSDDKYLPFHKIMFLYFYLKYVSIPLESFLYRLKTYQMKGKESRKAIAGTEKNYISYGQIRTYILNEESEKVGLKLNIQKTKIMASGPITLWQIDGETMETVTDYFFGRQKSLHHGRW